MTKPTSRAPGICRSRINGSAPIRCDSNPDTCQLQTRRSLPHWRRPWLVCRTVTLKKRSVSSCPGPLAGYVFSAVWERYLAECRSSVAPSFNGHGSDGQEGVAWFERSTFRTALSVLSHARCGGRVSSLVPFHLACPRRPSEPTPGRPRQKRGSSASEPWTLTRSETAIAARRPPSLHSRRARDGGRRHPGRRGSATGLPDRASARRNRPMRRNFRARGSRR